MPSTSAAASLAEDLPALCAKPRVPTPAAQAAALDEPAGAVIGEGDQGDRRFPGETSCLSLCWAVLDLFIASARGLALRALEHRQLAEMRAGRRAATPEALTAENVTAAQAILSLSSRCWTRPDQRGPAGVETAKFLS